MFVQSAASALTAFHVMLMLVRYLVAGGLPSQCRVVSLLDVLAPESWGTASKLQGASLSTGQKLPCLSST